MSYPTQRFTPTEFLELLTHERQWFKLLMRLCRRRETCPEGIESEAITIMLHDRARWLRN
jgi:hypothetical protein